MKIENLEEIDSGFLGDVGLTMVVVGASLSL